MVGAPTNGRTVGRAGWLIQARGGSSYFIIDGLTMYI